MTTTSIGEHPEDETAALPPIDEAAQLMHHWRFADAQALLFDMLSTHTRQLSPLQRTTVVRLLADASRELGDTHLATALLAPLLTECLRAFGGRHPATLRTAVSYALLLHQLGRDREADRMLHELLTDPDIDLTRPLAREAVTVTSLRTLIAARRGRATTGELRAQLGDCDIILGPDHPHTIRLTIALAHAHRDSGDLAAAHTLLAAARQDVIDQHGTEHPLVDHLGQALHELSEPDPPSADTPNLLANTESTSTRRHRWPVRAMAAAGAAGILLLAVTPAVLAAAQPQPVTWTSAAPASPMDRRPRDISITIDADTATIAWTNPPDTAQITVIVTVGGAIRTTETLPAVTAFAVRGLGPEGIVCAVITATGPHTAGTATTCVPPPRAQARPQHQHTLLKGFR